MSKHPTGPGPVGFFNPDQNYCWTFNGLADGFLGCAAGWMPGSTVGRPWQAGRSMVLDGGKKLWLTCDPRARTAGRSPARFLLGGTPGKNASRAPFLGRGACHERYYSYSNDGWDFVLPILRRRKSTSNYC